MLSKLLEPLKRFLEARHRHAEMERLRASGELDRILRDADKKGIYYDQAPNILDVLAHKQAMGKDPSRVAAYLSETEKALWWVVRRYREATGKPVDETLPSLAFSAVQGQVVDPIQRFLAKRHMKSELQRLRASGELDQILSASGYTTVGPAQGEWCEVYRKGTEADRSAKLFGSPLKDEAHWWIVQRHREEFGRKAG